MKELVVGRVSTKVDDELFEEINRYKWSFDQRYIYRKEWLLSVNGKQKYRKIYLHKFINQTPKGFDTDHIDGDKLNNLRENLRSATRSQNNMNASKTKDTTSKYKGVFFDRRSGKWRAEIKINGKAKYIGLFKDQDEAALAYNKAAELLFGDFCKTNKL